MDSTPSADSGLAEEVTNREDQFEEKADPKPSPTPEPSQQEYSDPAQRK